MRVARLPTPGFTHTLIYYLALWTSTNQAVQGGGAKSEGANLLFVYFFFENYVKMREIGPRGAGVPHTSLGATAITIFEKIFRIHSAGYGSYCTQVTPLSSHACA